MAQVHVEKIKELILEKYSDEKRFASAFGCDEITVKRWFEKGKINDNQLEKLAKFLALPMGELKITGPINHSLLQMISHKLQEITDKTGEPLSIDDHMAWVTFIYNNYNSETGIDERSIENILKKK
mgnify:CR=1 FL=1|tara:strand:- start:64 stop:441 length:378 start_codon:yes stop_codon:yes gene_type:complete